MTTVLEAKYFEFQFCHFSSPFESFLYCPTDCHYLAHFMVTLQEAAKAATIFRKTCDEYQYGESCQLYAGLLRAFNCIDPIESFRYDRKGCQLGRAKSCLNTALDIVSDGNVRQVVEEEKPDLLVVEMLDRGCNLGCDDSCYLAGGAYLVGVPGLLEKNVSTAYKYDVKACQLGNKLACANLSGALPIKTHGPMSNAFQVRRLQLKINKELSEKSSKLPATT